MAWGPGKLPFCSISCLYSMDIPWSFIIQSFKPRNELEEGKGLVWLVCHMSSASIHTGYCVEGVLDSSSQIWRCPHFKIHSQVFPFSWMSLRLTALCLTRELGQSKEIWLLWFISFYWIISQRQRWSRILYFVHWWWMHNDSDKSGLEEMQKVL